MGIFSTIFTLLIGVAAICMLVFTVALIVAYPGPGMIVLGIFALPFILAVRSWRKA